MNDFVKIKRKTKKKKVRSHRGQDFEVHPEAKLGWPFFVAEQNETLEKRDAGGRVYNRRKRASHNIYPASSTSPTTRTWTFCSHVDLGSSTYPTFQTKMNRRKIRAHRYSHVHLFRVISSVSYLQQTK